MEVPFYFYVNALAILIWGIYLSRLQSNLVRTGYYLVFCFCAEVGAWVYSYFTYRSNHWIYNIFTTIQIIFLARIYLSVLSSKTAGRWIRIVTYLYPLLVIANCLFVQSFFKFHTYTYLSGCVGIIVLIFTYYNQLLHSDQISPLRNNPFFWINIGNTIYFIGSLFYMGSINFILDGGYDHFGYLITAFVYSFTAVMYGCFIVALLCNRIPRTN